jgi:RHS repeat-associated protein
MPNPSEGTLTWDGENRLVKAVVNGTTVNYAYDHLSRLISRSEGVSPTTSTHYLYDGWNLIAEYTYADSEYTLAKTQLWGLDMTETPQGAGGVGGLLCIVDLVASTRHYPAYDLNGNVIAYFDSTGQPAAHFQYDPFGNLTVDEYSNAANFPYRFSTKPQDPVTGLYYYSYRYYDPVTGRWPTRDPIGEYGGINLYGFVGNDGVNDVDALGLIGKEDLLAIIVWGLATYGNFTDNIPLNDNCPKLPTSERIARDLNQRISNGTTRPNRGPGSGPMVPPASGGSPSNPAWRAPRGVPVWGVPLVWLGSTQTANAPGVVPTWGWPKRYLRLRLNESEACCDECIQNGSFVISYNKCKYDYEIKEVDDLGENVIEAGSVDTSCADGDCPGPSMWSSWTEINN